MKLKSIHSYIKSVWMVMLVLCSQSSLASDTLIVKKDPRLDVLSVKLLQSNQRSAMMLPNGLYRGFRIQVLSTNKRDDAFFTKADLQLKYPEEKIYVTFQSPSFKVRIGNFLKKGDAEKMKAELNKIYPNGVYIVEDAVEYILEEGEDIISQ